MDYGSAAVTALLTFISPCVLPMLPVYVTYFAAGKSSRWTTLFNAIAFCVGISIFFMTIFTAFSFASYAFKVFIEKHKSEIFIICGIILILFGLKFMGYLSLPFLDKTISIKANAEETNIINAFVLGLVFSVSMGSCAMGFASFNLITVITDASLFKGLTIGLVFTLTLDVLFIVCAMLVDQLKAFFSFIKRHYKVINMISGGLLVVFGFLLAMGYTVRMQAWLAKRIDLSVDDLLSAFYHAKTLFIRR